MKVSEVMSKAVVIDEDITLRQAAKIMSKKNIANVVVIKDGKISGYISERDVLINLSNLDKPLKNYMSKEVISISEPILSICLRIIFSIFLSTRSPRGKKV